MYKNTTALSVAISLALGTAAVAAPATALAEEPADEGGRAVTLGENIFFKGTPAEKGAPIHNGAFPLVLLSHGAGLAGHAGAMSWIAAPLAQEGFIVAAPTHPRNTGRDRSAEETMKL